MKALIVASEQRKFFRTHGFIAFEGLLSEADRKFLLHQIALREQSPPEVIPRQLIVRLPEGVRIARRLGAIAAELLERPSIRVVYDGLFNPINLSPSIKAREVALLFIPQRDEGLFFTDPHHSLAWYKGKKMPPWVWLCLFTANYVNEPLMFNGKAVS